MWILIVHFGQHDYLFFGPYPSIEAAQADQDVAMATHKVANAFEIAKLTPSVPAE